MPMAVQRTQAFMSGLHTGCFVAAAVCVLGALGATALPGRRRSSVPMAAGRVASTARLA